MYQSNTKMTKSAYSLEEFEADGKEVLKECRDKFLNEITELYKKKRVEKMNYYWNTIISVDEVWEAIDEEKAVEVMYNGEWVELYCSCWTLRLLKSDLPIYIARGQLFRVREEYKKEDCGSVLVEKTLEYFEKFDKIIDKMNERLDIAGG